MNNPHSKYQPLFDHLYHCQQEEIMLDFATIEAIMGQSLPPSARRNRGWWSNRDKGGLQAQSWKKASYHVVHIDLASEQVTFSRVKVSYDIPKVDASGQWNGHLIKALRRHMGYTQSQLADELCMRQQTISDWETGLRQPCRSSSKHLSLVAEQAGFIYKDDQ